MIGGLVLLVLMTDLWQFHVFWGLITGIGTGAVTNVLGATVALRWFRTHRGIVLGAFAAASSAGQLIFIPSLQAVVLDGGWRTAVAGMAAILGAMLLPVLFFMRDRPADVGQEAYGAIGDAATEAADRAEAVR